MVYKPPEKIDEFQVAYPARLCVGCGTKSNLNIETFHVRRSQSMWPRNKIVTTSGKVSIPICSECAKKVNEAEEQKPRVYLFGGIFSLLMVPFITLLFCSGVTGFTWPAWFIGASEDLYFSPLFLCVIALLGNMSVPILFIDAAKYLKIHKLSSPAEVFFSSTPSRWGDVRFQFKNQAYYESFKQANPALTAELQPSFRGPPSGHFNSVAMALLDTILWGVVLLIGAMVAILATQPILGTEFGAFGALIAFAVIVVFKLSWTAFRGRDDQGRRIRYNLSDIAGLLLSLNFYGVAMAVISMAAGYGGSLAYVILLTFTPIITFIIGFIVVKIVTRLLG